MSDLTRFATIFDIHLPTGLICFDSNGIILRTNQLWREEFKDLPFEVGDVFDFAELNTSIDLISFMEGVWNTKKMGQCEAHVKINGRDAHWNMIFEPLVGASSQTTEAMLLIVSDVTQQRENHQKLKMRIRDRTNKLQTVFDVITLTSNADQKDLNTVLQGCLEQVIDSTYSSGGAIQLLNDDANSLELRAHAGLEYPIVDELKEYPADRGLVGWTASHQETLIVSDLTHDWRTSREIRKSDINAYAGIPMHVDGKTIGVMSVFRERKRPFSQSDIDLLGSVADQIGVIVMNHELKNENNRLLLLEERNRLARQLHDAVTQSLYSNMLMSEALRKQAEISGLEVVQQIATQLQSNAHQALKEMRLLIHNLRPPILSSVGLARAIRHRLKAVEERAGIKHELTVRGEINLPNHIEETIYFVVQEALNNTLKHARADKVKVELSQIEGVLRIELVDDGIGFLQEGVEEGGLGLMSMQERMQQILGELEVNSTPNEGTTVEIVWRVHE